MRITNLLQMTSISNNLEDESANTTIIIKRAAEESLSKTRIWIRERGFRKRDDDITKIINDKTEAFEK
jgi:hypothetical protein